MFGIGSGRLAGTLVLVLTVGACSSTNRAATQTSTSSGASTTTTTARSTATPSSVPVPSADPLPGAVLLGLHERTIDALDARGRTIKTLVTVFAGRQVMNAQLMADHRTIWYSTSQGHPRTCDEVVKLDLRTNVRTVEAYALDFTISPDGSRLLLVWPKTVSELSAQCTEKAALTFTDHDAFVVRDLRTGAQSSISFSAYPTVGTGSPSGHVWMSAAGDELIDTVCTEDPCGTRVFTVPDPLGAALVGPVRAGPQCGCSTLVTGRDAVYGIDEGSFGKRQTRLRRYDPAHLTGPGTVLTTPTGINMWQVAPAAKAVYVLAAPPGAQTASLYRLDGGELSPLTPTSYSELFAIPAFAAV